MLKSKLIQRRISLKTERQKKKTKETDPADGGTKKESNKIKLKRKTCEITKTGFKPEEEVWKHTKRIKRGPNKHFTQSKFFKTESINENRVRL